MIKIGDFSKLSLISVRTLRHYDHIDLLKPEYIDTHTAYRYYTARQLHICHQIKALRSLGMSLNDIKDIIANIENTNQLEMFLDKQKQSLNKNLTEIQEKLNLLDNMSNQIKNKDKVLQYPVNLKTIPTRTVISLRKRIGHYYEEGDLWQMMMRELETQNILFSHPSYSMAIFHDSEYLEENVDVEIQMSVDNSIQSTDSVQFKTEQSQSVASIMLQGSYELMTRVNESFLNWIENSGYELIGPMFNIYHVGPNEETDPNKWLTEVCFPVMKSR